MRANRISLLMSGGMDSPSIAATIRMIGAKSGTPPDLRAFTAYFERLIPDEE
jgi:hypothetical protein